MTYRYEKNVTPQYKEDHSLTALYESITYMLRNDDALKGLVEYTKKEPNIRRGYMTLGTWDKLIAYYLQPDSPVSGIDDIARGTTPIRQAPLIFQLYSRTNDLVLYEIQERIIQLLHEADLTKDGHVFVYRCSYTGESGALRYQNDIESYVKTLRFLLLFRKED